jgi:hypothetical protein
LLDNQGIVDATTANAPKISRKHQVSKRALPQPLPVIAPAMPRAAKNKADISAIVQNPGNNSRVLTRFIDPTRNRAIPIEADFKADPKASRRHLAIAGRLLPIQTAQAKIREIMAGR